MAETLTDVSQHYRERAEVSMYWWDEDDEVAMEIVQDAMKNLMFAFKRAGVRVPALHVTGRK